MQPRAAQQAAGSAALASQPVSSATPQADSLAIGTVSHAASAVPAGAAAGASQKRHQLHGHAKQHGARSPGMASSEQHGSQQQHVRLAGLPDAGLELGEPSLGSAAALEAAVQTQPGKEVAPVQGEITRGASGASSGARPSQSASSSMAEAPSGSKGGPAPPPPQQQQQLQRAADLFPATADGGLAVTNERDAAVAAELAAPVGEPAAVPPRGTGPSVVGRVVGAGSTLRRWFSGGQR